MANDKYEEVRPRLNVLNPEQISKIHESSLEILRETGLNVHSEELRTLLAENGCKVKDNLRVHIPAELVEKALLSAPSCVDIFDRNNKKAMSLEGTSSYFGTGSDLEYTIDLKTHERRQSTLKDVELSACLCEKLKHIDFIMSYGLPNEVSPSDIEIEQFRVLLANTTKPIVMTIYSGLENFEKMHQMACESCGGEQNFRTAPNYAIYSQFVSPLQHDTGALDRLIFCADHKIPIIYVPTIMMGASGPVTLAGALALANAECLAGLVMHQLRSPGAPFIYGGCVSPLDMKTTVFSYGSPEWRIADSVLSELSIKYELPIFGTAGASDSLNLDIQAGAEWAYSLLTCALSGTNLIHDVGYLESGMTGSLEALVIVDEIIGMVKRVSAGFKINEDSLGLDMVKKIGPTGDFMAEEHTLEHYRKDVWYPNVFVRDRFDSRGAAGEQDVLQRAGERASELLKSHM